MRVRSSLRFIFSLAALMLSLVTARAHSASGPGAVRCLIEMMPISDRLSLGTARKNIEAPFVLRDRYVVFPAVKAKKVVGFYIYSDKKASYYDSVEVDLGATRVQRDLAKLEFSADHGVFDLITQHDGLETISIEYLPGFDPSTTDSTGAAVLGASVLPVVGAFVSRPNQEKISYYNPKKATEAEIQNWVYSQMQGSRRPANASDLPAVEKTVLKLKVKGRMSKDELLRPLREEIKIRRNWLKTNNLDEKTWSELNRILSMGCD